MKETAAIILAAGKSTRMKSELPKVLHEVHGHPMLSYALQACQEAGINRILVVVGHQKDQVVQAFQDAPNIVWVEQTEQLGTGHAVLVCEKALNGFTGSVVVIAGDMPLIREETISNLINVHQQASSTVTLATTELSDPTGYGRIVRGQRGELLKIVEHNDCSNQQLGIKEVNPSYYCFESKALFDALHRVTTENTKGEYYITEAVNLVVSSGQPSMTLPGLPPEDSLGINSQEDLTMVNEVMRQRAISSPTQ